MDKHITIALDGPAGCGKSTVAKGLSKRLGIIYLDTGAMYRAVAYMAIKNDINIDCENDELLKLLDTMDMNVEFNNGEPNIIVDGENVSTFLRSKEVSAGSSAVAKIPAVREKLVKIQQEIAKENSVVMDGRDIGTKVLPESKHKFFLTASIDERVRRRFLDVKASGMSMEEVKEAMIRRDENDTKRAASPLVKADDAIEIDTSDISAEQVISLILKQVKADVL